MANQSKLHWIDVNREWLPQLRFQSKTKGTSMSTFDLLGTGSLQLVIGWESGKVISVIHDVSVIDSNHILFCVQVDIRDIVTGESLFKLQLNQMVTSVTQADYRGRGANDLIICTKNGDGKWRALSWAPSMRSKLYFRFRSKGIRAIKNQFAIDQAARGRWIECIDDDKEEFTARIVAICSEHEN